MAPRAKKENTMAPSQPITKEQKEVIHWVRRNVATKKTKFLHSHVVEYFTGCQAVDALFQDSPWAKDKAKPDAKIVFQFREQAIEFMDDMLKQKMFHRAKKIPVQDKKSKKKVKEGKEDKTDTEKDETPRPKKDDKGKKKRKIRLDMHLEQIFLDSKDAYVWLYDPIPWYYWVGGAALLLGIIAVCLFPLWPPMMRQGVHYLSIAAAGFLVAIIGLAVLKYLLFVILFAVTAGQLRFWIFPNLTEDVGFFESFMPAYDYTYTGKSWVKKKKAKDSDDEESDDEEEEETKKDSESDDSTSKKSSTGKDFEIVDKNDTDVQDE